MLHNKPSSKNHISTGFTLIEMLVVAPLVILIIVAFVSLVLTTTGSVLVSKSQSTLIYNIQDALNRIEQDTKQSGAFLSTDNITLPTGSVQGYNNSSTGFENVSSTQTGTALILNTYATSSNPINIASVQPLYASNQPNACASSSIAQNTLVYLNVVYFVQNNSLWRRVIVPAGYPGTSNSFACGTPWQQASCSPGYTASAYCSTNDIDLVDGVSSTGFTVSYYPTSSSTVASTIASDPTQSDPIRQAAMNGTNTIGVGITATQTVAGRSFTQSASLRVTALNNDPTATLTTPAPTITSQPSSTSVASGSNATFTVGSNPSTGVSYQWQQSIDGGVSFQNINGATSSTLSVSATSVYMNLYQYQAVVGNNSGSVTSNPATMTVTSTGWTTLAMQNGWYDYGGTFTTAGFRMTSYGLVILKGLEVKTTSVPVSGEVLGQLPMGYRPSIAMLYENTSSTGTGRIDITAAGQILYQVGGAGFYSLDGLSFYPSSTTYITANPVPSWVNYAPASWAPFGYYQAPDGRVSLRGLLGGGVVTNGTTMVSVPSALEVGLYEHIGEDDANTGQAIGLDVNGAVEAKGYASNGYVSTNALYYPNVTPYVGTTTSASCGTASPSTYVLSSGWCTLTPLQNSWAYYGSPYSLPRYTKSIDGIVSVKGLIHSGTTTATTVIANLPSGFRPAAEVLETIAIDSSTTGEPTWGRVDILPNGNIITETVNATWTSLDSVYFYADGS